MYNLQWKQVSNIKKKLIQKKFKRETKNIYIEKSEEYKEKNYNHDSYNEFDSNVSNCTWLHWPCLQCGLALGHSPEDRGLLKQTIIDWCGICEINKEINLLFFFVLDFTSFFSFLFLEYVRIARVYYTIKNWIVRTSLPNDSRYLWMSICRIFRLFVFTSIVDNSLVEKT